MTEQAGARVRLRAVVHGRVQGVWFRGATEEQANRHNVDGWVRNRPDGCVEAVFEGPQQNVATLIEFVRRGPPAARVERVETLEEMPRGERGFRVRRTGDEPA
jgi:acylphosphatase